MKTKFSNAGREIMAALILLAAISIFIDFRVGGGNRAQVRDNSSRVSHLEGSTSIEELSAEVEELKAIVGTLLEEREGLQSLEPPKENLDTPLKEGSK